MREDAALRLRLVCGIAMGWADEEEIGCIARYITWKRVPGPVGEPSNENPGESAQHSVRTPVGWFYGSKSPDHVYMTSNIRVKREWQWNGETGGAGWSV